MINLADIKMDCLDCKATGIMGGPGGYYDVPGRGKPCPVCDGTKKAPAAVVLAELARITADMDNVGEYGYGGEVFDHYVVSNWEVVVAVIVAALPLVDTHCTEASVGGDTHWEIK